MASTLASRTSADPNSMLPTTGKGKQCADDPSGAPPQAKKQQAQTCQTCKKDTCQGAFNSWPCQFSGAGSGSSVHGAPPALAASSSSGGLRQSTIDGIFGCSTASGSSDGTTRGSYYC